MYCLRWTNGVRMISALLSTVQTTLLGSRGFLLTSLLPMVLFSIGSYLIDAQLEPKHAIWASQFIQDKPGFATSCAVLIILVAAYMFSSLNSVLRQVLEGKYLRKWRRNPFVRYQMKIAEDARRRFDESQRSYWTLSQAKWIDELRQARAEGAKKAVPAAAVDADLKASVAELTGDKDALKPLDHAKLKKAVDDLSPYLKAADANKKDQPNSKGLSDLHVALVQNIQYEIGRLQRDRTQAYWDSASFPDDVMPTRMGNIAGTLRYYAESRYGILLDVFWTRLQKLIQSDEKSFSTLQDAKIQLDFFVSLVWLSALFSLFWSAMLMAFSTRIGLFLLVSGGGFLAMVTCYQLGCQSYLTFAEVVRGAIDLTRFQLISAYHLPLPLGSGEEERLWETMADWVAYDSRSGGVLYEHKTQ